MRYDLYDYVIHNPNIYLVHNDMFPYKHERIVDLALSEFITLPFSFGLTLNNPDIKVIIFGVSHFLIDKLIYFANVHQCRNIFIANGGAGFTYYPFPNHYLVNDLSLMKSITPYVYAPTSKEELFAILDKTYDNLVYIRLFPETKPSIKLQALESKIPVYAYGWVYKYLKPYIKPIIRWDLETKLPYDCILIEDHIRWQKTKYWFGLTKHQTMKGHVSMNDFLLSAWKYIKQLN